MTIADEEFEANLIAALSEPTASYQEKGRCIEISVGAWPADVADSRKVDITDRRALAIIAASLRHNNPRTRANAAYAIGQLRESGLLRELIQLTDDQAALVRRGAVGALMRFPVAESLEAILNAMRDDDATVRMNACYTIEEWVSGNTIEINRDSTAHSLSPMLTDWEVGPYAARALTALEWEPADDVEAILFLAAQRSVESRNELLESWDHTQRLFLKYIREGDTIAVENAVLTLIGLGNRAILPKLHETIMQFGHKNIAEAYINSGSDELESYAREWASKNGYSIEKGDGARPVRWGSWGGVSFC